MHDRPIAPAQALSDIAPEARARVASFATVPEVLAHFGVAPEPLLARVGLRVEDCRDPRRTISLQQADDLLGACVRSTGCEHFGLLAGDRMRLEHLGLVGLVAASAETVGQALRDLTQLYDARDTAGAPALAVHRADAFLTYGFHGAGPGSGDQAYDFVVATMCRVMRELCGEAWRPAAVHLPRPRPASIEPYEEVFGAPLKFAAKRAAVVFPATTLARRIPTADPASRRRLVKRVRSDLLRIEPALVGEVRRAIATLLESGACSRSAVAARLGLHERTMTRRLQLADTTFKRLLEETRADVAQDMLRVTDATVASIAVTIGYRDSTVFGRAFRRWTGVTPRQFRARLQSSEVHPGRPGPRVPPDGRL